MNLYLRQITPYTGIALFCITLFFTASTACADIREDAETALSTLRRNNAAQKLPDEMKSLDMVYEAALRYFMVGDREKADNFYLLTLQKARMIEEMLRAVKSAPAPKRAESSSPPDQSVTADASSDVADDEPPSSRLVGSRGSYSVVNGDSIRLVAAKLGVTQQHLRGMNRLDSKASLKIGQKLAYNNRKIIPRQIKDGIVINIPDRTLYFFQRGTLVTSLPVALGSSTKNEKYVWQTPVGKFKITSKMKNPTWTVPPSIQSEMEEKGKDVVASVAPGPENPLGKFAFKTSIPGILIHSTIRPSSIYSFSSHGCIRLAPDQMEGFFPQVKVNTVGEIIYKPVKLAVTENGRIFLEVHHDVYNKSANLVAEARQMVEKQNLSDSVNWEKFKSVVLRKSGIAEDISL